MSKRKIPHIPYCIVCGQALPCIIVFEQLMVMTIEFNESVDKFAFQTVLFWFHPKEPALWLVGFACKDACYEIGETTRIYWSQNGKN